MTIHPLGKRPVRLDHRTFRLSNFLPTPTITPPSAQDWASDVKDWGMMLNDTLGDCVAAAAGHMVQQWTTYARVEHVVPDAKILQSYEKVGGYVPGDPTTDNGLDMLSYLNFWRHHGLGRPNKRHRHRIKAYMSINPRNTHEMRLATYLFGNVYLGLQLPVSVQGADKWEVPSTGPVGDGEPGSWGGHCVPIVQYYGDLNMVITWGQRLWTTDHFIHTYADEAYAVLSREWLAGSGVAPSGFNFDALEEALAKL